MSSTLIFRSAKLKLLATLTLALSFVNIYAQSSYELNTGWKCAPITSVKDKGTALSTPAFNTTSWMPATVPGTVLTTLLNNQKVPDPFWGMNNEHIADIYKTGADYYTYWFTKDFTEAPAAGSNQVYLNFRG
jgi:mannosylglycoprotein endo-beta-mannosidase